jgi:hypothetical protein
MIVENVSVSYTQKFNLGNFESLELGVFIHAKTEGEDHEACAELLIEQARERVLTEAKRVTAAHDITCPSVKKYFYGKPIDEFPSVVSGEAMGFKIGEVSDDIPF